MSCSPSPTQNTTSPGITWIMLSYDNMIQVMPGDVVFCVGEGEHDIPWHHLDHVVVRHISCAVLILLRRPQVLALQLLAAVRLPVIHPPVSRLLKHNNLRLPAALQCHSVCECPKFS